MFRMASGRLMNHLRRAWRPPQFVSGSEDPIFPIARAYDHRTGAAAMFADTILDSAVVVDKDVLIDGDFSQPELEGWVVDEGDVDPDGLLSVEATAFHQDVAAVPGEVWSISLDVDPSESSELTAKLRNLQTGRWWDGVDWSDDEVPLLVASSSTVQTWEFKVEDYAECRAHEVALRLTISALGGTVNEAAMWPHADLACIFGYNYPGGGLIPWIIDESAASFERGFLRDHGMNVLWAYLGECKANRLWRFKWAGTPIDPIGFGELVLTQTTKIARANAPGGVAPRLDMELEARIPQERESAPSGALYISPNGSGSASRSAQMSFFLTCEEELSRLRDEVFGPSQGGAHPSILIGPTAIGREACMFGRFEDRLPQSFPGGPGVVYAKVDLGFLEDVFPRYSTVLT